MRTRPLVSLFGALMAWSGSLAAHSAISATLPDIPDSIGGYSVLAVLTDSATADAKAALPAQGTAQINAPVVRQPCMMAGEKRLVFQSPQPTIEDALRDFPKEGIAQELQALNLAEYAHWGWTVVGPSVTRQQLVKQLNKSYRFSKVHGCSTLTPPIAASPAAAVSCDARHECTVAPPYRGFAIIQDADANIGTVGNNAQSVFLVAPVVGNNQEQFSAFLNNVVTDATCFIWPGFDWPSFEPCFLQVGFTFQAGQGTLVWTDDIHGLTPQDLGIPYIPGHDYWTTITYTNGTWWMCAVDTQDTAKYTCKDAPWTSGTHLQGAQPGEPGRTSIFVENLNPNSDWYKGFSEEWSAYGAQIYVGGIGHNWSAQDTWTIDACSIAAWPPGEAIFGSLAGGGRASFRTSGIPTKCGSTAR